MAKFYAVKEGKKPGICAAHYPQGRGFFPVVYRCHFAVGAGGLCSCAGLHDRAPLWLCHLGADSARNGYTV